LPHVAVVTVEERLRRDLVERLAQAGHAVRTASTWPALVREVAAPGCGLVLIDGRLQGLDTELLQALSASLPEPPELRSVGGPALPIRPAPARPDLQLRLARRCARAVIQLDERRELDRMGLDNRALPLLADVATRATPIRIEGERGTGKERVARVIHRLAAAEGPLLSLDARPGGAEPAPVPDGPPGVLYIRQLEEWSRGAVSDLEDRAGKAGWRMMGGTRVKGLDNPELAHWTPVRLRPLRERHDDLKALTRLYVERYRRRQGLPRRRLDRSMWPLILSHPWPGNGRELETFAMQLVTSCPGPTFRARDLPEAVSRLLESAPDAALREQAVSFEELVEARLRPMVQQFELGSDVGLYRLAIDATERALIRLALSRTRGNQKAAASLLGVARNTLRTKATELGVTPPSRRRRKG